ncbi:Steroid C26-monooxygenase [Zhongshania aliphaticivorans]|uniref:Steroid C26-monooxygenase n=1 Tax=Zhongshania aliphaticivorans TaxID=1470434 RepID=A0A5S9P6D5_9GAMM|nr:Steroid C26-monooxygenase [Zhongshania aliphaticivorans]CAA0099104.1 Steroid C26-monooxygenase [Zhongshania aliphaticivorans]
MATAGSAAGKCIRWVTSVELFSRTVLQVTELSGVIFKKGDAVALFFLNRPIKMRVQSAI